MRKDIHDKIITDLKALKYEGTSNDLFVDVKKIFAEVPTTTPVCRVIPTAVRVEVIGNSTDERVLGFEATVYEKMDTQNGVTEAETKIDRLSNIEDQLIAYFEQLPNAIEHEVGSYHVVKTSIQPSNYNYAQDESGISVYLSVNVDVHVVVTPQLL